jgi:hypothetical protein
MTKNTSLLGKNYWKNFFKLLLQALLIGIVAGILGAIAESEILFFVIFLLGILYFGRSFYIKNRLDQMDIFKNRLLETGEYDLERLNSMSYMELNLRQAFHKVVPNASELSYDEFKAMTKAKGKEAVVAAAQATGEIVGAISAGLEKAASTENTSSSKAMVCRNCGHRMGFFQKNKLHGGVFGNPCEKEGKFCVANN